MTDEFNFCPEFLNKSQWFRKYVRNIEHNFVYSKKRIGYCGNQSVRNYGSLYSPPATVSLVVAQSPSRKCQSDQRCREWRTQAAQCAQISAPRSWMKFNLSIPTSWSRKTKTQWLPLSVTSLLRDMPKMYEDERFELVISRLPRLDRLFEGLRWFLSISVYKIWQVDRNFEIFNVHDFQELL